jgi:predicted AAA+ superfamily ATPase
VREQGGRREADLLVELDGHRVIAIEIKASASPRPDSARHLTWLRDELEDRFVHGLVMHAGRYLYELSDRITAVPICTLWT